MSTYRILVSILLLVVVSVNTSLSQDKVKLKVESAEGMQGQTVCVDVTVGDFKEIETFFFTLTIDTSIIRFSTPDCGVTFNTANTDINQFSIAPPSCVQGGTQLNILAVLNVSSGGPSPITLPDGTTLLTICFELVGEVGDKTFITLSNNDSTVPQFDDKGVAYEAGMITIVPESNKIELISSYCNPTAGSQDGKIIFSAIGGRPPYSYEVKQTGQTGQIANALDEVVLDNLNQQAIDIVITDSDGLMDSKSVVLVSTTSVTHNIMSTANLKCFDDENGVIEVLGNSSGKPYTYYLYNKEGSGKDVSIYHFSKINYLTAGAYFVDATDENGCKTTHGFVINQPEELKGENFEVQINCHDSKPILKGKAVGGTVTNPSQYSFKWYEDEKGILAIGQAMGNPVDQEVSVVASFVRDDVWVEIEDKEGCRSERFHVVGQRPDSIKLTVDTFYACNGYKVDIGHSGGVGTLKYTWSHDASIKGVSLQGADKGTYTVIVEDENGCTKDTTFTLPRQKKIASIDNSNIQISEPTCPDSDDGVIELTGVAGWSAEWYLDKEKTMKIDALDGKLRGESFAAGTYYVVLSNSSLDCPPITLEPLVTSRPELKAEIVSQTDPKCEGIDDGSITLTGTGGNISPTSLYQFELSGVGSRLGGVGDNVTYNNLMAGTYTLTIKDDKGCDSKLDFEIKNAEPFAVIIDSTLTKNKSCRNDVVVLAVKVDGGASPYTYTWRKDNGVLPGSSSANKIENLDAGTYNLTVRDANNCRDSLDASFVVVPGDIAIKFSEPTYEAIKCFGEKTCLKINTATGGSGTGYRFRVNEGPDFKLDECQELFAGTHSVVVYDSDDCPSSELKIQISEPEQVLVEVIDTIKVKLGEETDVVVAVPNTNIDRVIWTENTGIEYVTMDSLNVKFKVFNDTRYEVQVIDADGCIGRSTVFVDVIKTKRIPIPNAFSPNNDGTNDLYEVYLPAAVKKVSFFRIYDRSGAPLMTKSEIVPENGYLALWDGKVRGRAVDPGVYVWTARYEFVDGSTATRTGTVTVVDRTN